MFKVFGIIGISKIEVFNFSGTERVKRIKKIIHIYEEPSEKVGDRFKSVYTNYKLTNSKLLLWLTDLVLK